MATNEIISPALLAEPIELEGEYYLPTIPTINLLNELDVAVHMATQFGDQFSQQCRKSWEASDKGAYLLHTAGILVAGTQQPKNVCKESMDFRQDLDDDWALEILQPKLTLNWRPVLMPLSNDKIKRLDTVQNPNGSTITCGGIMVDGIILDPYDAPVHVKEGTIRIVNGTVSGGEPWIYWNGLLVCGRCPLRINPIQLYRNRLLAWDAYKREAIQNS